MDWSRDRELGVRMVLTLVLLGVVTVALVCFIYGMISAPGWIIALLSETPPSAGGTSIIGVIFWTIVIIGVILYIGHPGETPALHGFTDRVENEEHPGLDEIVQRLAQQADLPVPSVIVAETTLPNAYTSGLSSERATIVVTTGLIEQLEEREIEAVLAHELAHVKNRDAAVMTIASVPLIISHTIYDLADAFWMVLARNSSSEREIEETIAMDLAIVCFTIAGVLWFLGRLLIRLLSRYRELAADRGAVALTGSPASLASALESIATGIESLPKRDLRALSGSSEEFAIVPVGTDASNEPIRLAPDDERRHPLFKYTHWFRKRLLPLFDTHPSMETRVKQLQDLEKEL